MLCEKYSEELHCYEFVDEIAVLRRLHMLFSHEMHELSDKLRDHKVQRSRYEYDDDSLNDVPEEGEDEVLEEVMFFFGVVEALDPFE